MIPARYATVAFAFILSALMSFLISGLSTWRALGLPPDFVSLWIGNWLVSWAIAFPTVLLIAPIARRIVGALVAKA